MHRIFRKSTGQAARSAAHRARRQRPVLEALEGRQLLSLGTEFRANTTTRNAQGLSDNASAANGLSVTAWVDQSSTTHLDNDIRAQMFNADGSLHGSEIVVEFSSANQNAPKVAMDADGDFVVAYEEATSGNVRDIIAQRFNSSGQKVGGRIAVATLTKNEFDPDVAMDASGNFVVSYTEEFSSTDKDIRAVRFNSAGTSLGFVSTARTSTEDERHASVAMSPDGRFDIVYESQPHSGGPTVLNIGRYSAAGSVLSDQPLSNGGFGQISGRNPDVAMDAAGNAVAVFQVTTTGGPGGNVPAPVNIDGVRVNSNGTFGGQFTVSSSGRPNFPSVALARTGGAFVVAYENDLLGATQGNRTVEVHEMSATDARGAVFNLPALPNNSQPAVSIDGGGHYLLTFTAGVGSATQDIHLRRGQLPGAPAAKNLTLTPSIHAGQFATLRGQLTDADADPKLKLAVSWGDGSNVQKSQPGLKPFSLAHKFARAGTYTVRVTWTDSTGLSNSKALKVKVLS